MLPLLVILVIGLPWFGALTVLIARRSHPQTQTWLAVGFTVLAGIASLLMLPLATTDEVIHIQIGGIFGYLSFVPDGLGCFLAAIASVIGCLTVIFSVGYMHGEQQTSRYYSLVLIFIGAMSGLVLTDNLFLLVVFWEIVAFCSYALISYYGTPEAIAGGIKALVVTQIGGIGLLVGVLIVYATLGTYQFDALLTGADKLPANILALVAFLFLAAAAAKSAQVPFHTWLPGAMEAPTPVSALIHAATMVNAGIYLLVRFYPVFANVPGWTTAIIIVGLLSILLAGVLALVANDLKRVLAYSTISQLGYMFVAIGLGALFASQFHLLSHAVFKALLFLVAGTVVHAVGTRDMRVMGGLGSKMPYTRVAAWIGALALVGIPILNGFWSKELILESGADSSSLVFAAMLVGVFLTALYSIRLLWLVFYGKPRQELPVHPTARVMSTALVVLSVGTLTTWLFGGGLSTLLSSTLPHHALSIESLGQITTQVGSAATTWIVLVVIALAVLTWFGRGQFTALLKQGNTVMTSIATSDWGFESLNTGISSVVQRIAARLQTLQTGQLNWNVMGVVLGLAALLLFLEVMR
jgi:NADH-quinone oxidoreductase subunit L